MAGAGTFDARMAELSEKVGDGKVRGGVEVDQVYAQYQHEGLDLRHPRGGQAKYLEQPLYGNHRGYLQDIASRVLREGPVRPMSEAMEDLSGQVAEHAPVEFWDLRMSGHPTVARGGAVVYDRPPMQARLTPAQLRAKNQLRALRDSAWGSDYL